MTQREQESQLRTSAVLFDASVFAYFGVAVELLLFILGVNVTDQSSYLKTQDEYLWVGSALACIFWAVGFATFISPVSSLFLAIYIGYRYWIANELPAEHNLIVAWYFLSVFISLTFSIAYRINRSWSLGAKLFKIPVYKIRSTNEHSRKQVFGKILSALIIPELLESVLIKEELGLHGQKSEALNSSRCLSRITLLSISLGIVGGFFWRVPLVIGAREIESRSVHKNDLVSPKLPIVWWLYAGDGTRALQIAESQLSRELEKSKSVSKDEVIAILFWIDRADRAGYCSSARWDEISSKVMPFLPSWMESCSGSNERHLITGIAKYLSDGCVRHNGNLNAEKIDQLLLSSTLKAYGFHSGEYLHSLYNSAIFHSRIKNYPKALEQFKLLVQEGDKRHEKNQLVSSAEIAKAKEQIVLLGLKPIRTN